jgi:hypothetical protein
MGTLRFAHPTQLKTMFFFASVYGVEQNFAAFVTNKPKVSVVAPNGDVIAMARNKLAWLARHGDMLTSPSITEEGNRWSAPPA